MRNERMYQEFIELVTTDSASGKESAIAALLRRKLEDLGFTVTQDHAGDTFGGECGNIFAYMDGTLCGSVLFCSHMDRVPNGLGIKPVEQDGILYSDGNTILAADDVSGLCAILEGVRQVLAAGIPLPRIEILFTVGEEAGLYGAAAMDMNLIHSDIAYLFDSPGHTGRLVNSAPGMYYLSCEITGRAAHAGNEPEKGINAAKIMCDILATLKQGRLDECTTSNFPIISTSGTATNVVCDYAYFKGEVRSREWQRLEDYVIYFEKHCADVIANASDNSPTHQNSESADNTLPKIQIHKESLFKPFSIPENHRCIDIAKRACAALNIPCTIECSGGAMDANIFNARGLTAIGVATGYSKNHTKQEQLILEDFFRSGDLAAQILQTYAK